MNIYKFEYDINLLIDYSRSERVEIVLANIAIKDIFISLMSKEKKILKYLPQPEANLAKISVSSKNKSVDLIGYTYGKKLKCYPFYNSYIDVSYNDIKFSDNNVSRLAEYLSLVFGRYAVLDNYDILKSCALSIKENDIFQEKFEIEQQSKKDQWYGEQAQKNIEKYKSENPEEFFSEQKRFDSWLKRTKQVL